MRIAEQSHAKEFIKHHNDTVMMFNKYMHAVLATADGVNREDVSYCISMEGLTALRRQMFDELIAALVQDNGVHAIEEDVISIINSPIKDDIYYRLVYAVTKLLDEAVNEGLFTVSTGIVNALDGVDDNWVQSMANQLRETSEEEPGTDLYNQSKLELIDNTAHTLTELEILLSEKEDPETIMHNQFDRLELFKTSDEVRYFIENTPNLVNKILEAAEFKHDYLLYNEIVKNEQSFEEIESKVGLFYTDSGIIVIERWIILQRTKNPRKK